MTIDLGRIKKDFPILSGRNRGQKLVYLDSAATAQKPRQVLDAISNFYLHDYANVHRGIYELSERASGLYANARESTRGFINASHADEIVFVSGTTEGINLIAHSFARSQLKAGDEIIITELEHHSNIVPWYLIKEQYQIEVKVVPIHDDGSLNLDVYQSLLNERTKLVAISHVSNALGTVQPIKEMTKLARRVGASVLIDGAQAAPHLAIDVQDLDCDFYIFSGHKLYGPTGTGVLYVKNKWLTTLPPYQSGGGMIETVSFEKITYAKGPEKFEAGTPHIAGVIGLNAAIEYLTRIGMDTVTEHEQKISDYAEAALTSIPKLTIYGTAKPKVGVISFLIDGIHPHDLGTVLDQAGVAVRAGHHCAMPLMERLNVPATVRVSFGIYTEESDIDALVRGIQQAVRLFA